MQLPLWNVIVSANAQVHRLIDQTLPVAQPNQSQSFQGTAPATSALEELRTALRECLAELETRLVSQVSDLEVHQVLLPLIIHTDEIVLRRLPAKEQTRWPLLQRERFEIDDGGDVFYRFADERLQHADTPVLVFEVLYFCLADGFVGRYSGVADKIAAYKTRLAAKIPMPELTASRRRHRPRDPDPARPPEAPADGTAAPVPWAMAEAPPQADPAPRTSQVVALYLGTLLLICLVPYLIILLSAL